MARTVLFRRGVRHAVTAAVLLAASAARARAQPGLTPSAPTTADGGALPFIRDDGGTFVDARVAEIGGGDGDYNASSQAIDVRAQVRVTDTVGVYGAIGGARVHADSTDPGGPDVITTVIRPHQPEVGGFLHLRGASGAALTLSLGAVLPVSSEPATPFVELAEPQDGVRGFPAASVRIGATASVRNGTLVAAAHVGGTLMPSWREPVMIDFAGAAGVDAPAASVVLGVGGYHAIGAGQYSPATTLCVGLDAGHRFGRAQAWLGARAGHSVLFEVGVALEGGVRYDF